MSIEERIVDLGYALPDVATPVGNFAPYKRTGNLLYISGQIPIDSAGRPIRGIIGDSHSVEDGYELAKAVGLYLIATVREAAGSLDNVSSVIKINGYVNAVSGFDQQPAIINGCSDLLVEIWGEKGRHARAAIGVAGLPAGVPVEIDGVFELNSRV